MAGFYRPGEYDVAGFAVGAVSRKHILPKNIQEGDYQLQSFLFSATPTVPCYQLIQEMCYWHYLHLGCTVTAFHSFGSVWRDQAYNGPINVPSCPNLALFLKFFSVQRKSM